MNSSKAVSANRWRTVLEQALARIGLSLGGIRSLGAPARRVLYGGACLLVILYLASIAVSVESRRWIIEDSKRELGTLNAVLTEETSRSFDSVQIIVNEVAREIGRRYLSSSSITDPDWAQRLLISRSRGIAALARLTLTDSVGEVLAISEQQCVAINFSDTNWFRYLTDHPTVNSVISEPFKSRLTGEYVVVFAQRLIGDGGIFLGTVAGTVQLRHFSDLYGTIPLGSSGAITLWHSNGLLMASSPGFSAVGTAIVNPAVFGAVDLSESVTAYEVTSPLTGTQVMASILSVQRGRVYPFVLAVSRSRDTVLTGWMTGNVAMIAANLVITLLAALFIWALIRQFVGYEAVTRANSERLRAEKERMEVEEQLRQSQKLEMVGQLTTGIAHDFNNILTVVIGNLDIMGRKVKGTALEPEVRRQLDAASGGAKNAADLTRRLLAFARKQPLAPASIRLCSILDDVAEMLGRTIGETVEINVRVEDGTWQVWADANQLDNVLVNLALNARDSMVDGGKLSITAKNIDISDSLSPALDGLKGSYVAITVADTGTGMAADVLDRVFEPFFTTKEIGKGSGLGLSQVYGFAKQSDGTVLIDSAVGIGTRVTIYLPKAVEAGARAGGQAQAIRRGAGQLILVVDDNTEVREYSVAALEDLGYTVLSAEDACDAMGIIRRHKVDMLFADVGLPGVDGPTLARQMLELQPETPVLYMSGYAKNVLVEQGKIGVGDEIVLKPFAFAAISEKIAAALSSKQPS